jgi:hypothetical protein
MGYYRSSITLILSLLPFPLHASLEYVPRFRPCWFALIKIERERKTHGEGKAAERQLNAAFEINVSTPSSALH